MYKRYFSLFAVVLAVLVGCPRSNERTGAAQQAPDFTLQDMNGKDVQLSDYKGKTVLLDFWATWCSPCRDSVPGVEKLHKAYSDKGLVVLAISVDGGGWDEVRAFQQQSHMTYIVLQGTEEVAALYSVRTIPLMVLVDKSGKLLKRYLGGGSEEDVERDLRNIL